MDTSSTPPVCPRVSDQNPSRLFVLPSPAHLGCAPMWMHHRSSPVEKVERPSSSTGVRLGTEGYGEDRTDEVLRATVSDPERAFVTGPSLPPAMDPASGRGVRGGSVSPLSSTGPTSFGPTSTPLIASLRGSGPGDRLLA